MALPVRDNIDVGQFQIQNVALHTLSSAPSSPATGQIYFNTATLKWYVWNGTAWIDPTARANQTGTQLSSTISDLGPTVKAYTLDSFAAPINPVPFNSQRLTGLADPTGNQDAATKNYVDTNIQASAAGISSKAPVQAVATANITTLSGLPTVDGITLTSGQRILLTGQTTASQNGPYVVASGAWSRPTGDASPNNELTLGALWYVEQGTTYGSTQWILASPTSGTITPGTTNVTINQFGAAPAYTASNGVAKTGNNFAGAVDPAGRLSVSSAGFAAGSTIPSIARGTITGDGSTTAFAVTHNLGVQNVLLQLADSNGNITLVSTKQLSTTQGQFSFGQAPANGTTYSWLAIG